ncbi:DUF6578 domain-containing protein [Streptomyces sp. NPDC051452]|uniref:DUF6578 domain-containing protein n=1 Tax=Streptomyces sp. NPDC051452 TaxID=3365654 RepID=UPI0037A708F6
MARIRVFYEDWQMGCCGTPFAVGDEVGWRLVAVAPDTHRDEYHGAEAWVENHGGPDQATTGRVHAIDLVRQEYVAYTDQRALERIDRARARAGTEPGEPILLPSPYRMEQVPGAWTPQSVDSCPKWFETEEPGRTPGPHRIHHTKGALVTLDVTGTSPILPNSAPGAHATDSGTPGSGVPAPEASAPAPGCFAPGAEGSGIAPGLGAAARSPQAPDTAPGAPAPGPQAPALGLEGSVPDPEAPAPSLEGSAPDPEGSE